MISKTYDSCASLHNKQPDINNSTPSTSHLDNISLKKTNYSKQIHNRKIDQTSNNLSDDTFMDMMIATSYGNIARLKEFINKGANVKIFIEKMKSRPRDNPLELAINREDFELAEILLKEGANPNILEKFFSPYPLALGAHKDSSDALKKIIQLCIDYGADVNAQNRNHETILYSAIKYHRQDLAQILRDNNAYLYPNEVYTQHLPKGWESDIMRANQALTTKETSVDRYIRSINSMPLILAIQKSNLQFIKILLQEGANANVIDSLIYFLEQNIIGIYDDENHTKKIIELLINHGADINMKIYGGHSLLSLAIERKDDDLQKFLLDKGASYRVNNPLNTTTNNNRATKRINLPPTQLPCAWKFIMSQAINNSNADTIKTLIKQGADINSYANDTFTINPSNNPTSALAVAVLESDIELAEMLLKEGVNPNIMNLDFIRLLQSKISRSKDNIYTKEIQQLLIHYGATDININTDTTLILV